MSRLTATNTGVDVLVTDTAVLAADLGRRELTIVNEGANKIYLALGATAVAGQGIALAAGGSYTTNLWQGTVRAIALVGTTHITACTY